MLGLLMVNIMFVIKLFNVLHCVSVSVSVPDSSFMRCDEPSDGMKYY